MSYHARHRWGGNSDLPMDQFPALLAELDEHRDDQEHIDVSVVHESGWSVQAYLSGAVVLENVEELDLEPRHLRGASRADVIEMFQQVATGDLDALERWPWAPGYHS